MKKTFSGLIVGLLLSASGLALAADNGSDAISFVPRDTGFKHFTANGKNIEIAKRLFEYFNKHDWEKMVELYTDPAEFLDPAFGQKPVIRTRKQTIQKHKELQAMSKDIRDDIVQIFLSGDKNVIVEFVSSGTAPDGTKWTLPLCIVFTIENGKITKDHTYYDNSK